MKRSTKGLLNDYRAFLALSQPSARLVSRRRAVAVRRACWL